MGSSGSQVTGYQYFLGMHMVIGHGPFDYLSNIYVDKRDLWPDPGQIGKWTGGSMDIVKPFLFGGEDREGGIGGTFELWMGDPDQVPTGEFAKPYQPLVPGFRGVVSFFFPQAYLGVNPYLKPWGFRACRIRTTDNGETQWYPEKAPIGQLIANPIALYIAVDKSASMKTITGNGKTRLANAKTAINGLLDWIDDNIAAPESNRIDIYIVGFDGTKDAILRRSVTSADIVVLKSFVSSLVNVVAKTDFRLAVQDASDFFVGSPPDAIRKFIFITDGIPFVNGSPGEEEDIADEARSILFGLNNLQVLLTGAARIQAHGINIDLADTTYTAYLDNTPDDGIPVVSGSDPDALTNIIRNVLFGFEDMNPAHILRELLTNTQWGRGHPISRIDDDTFTAVADTLYEESFGLSMKWSKQTTLENLRDDVLRHINGVMVVSRSTAKWKLKLIRDDYDPDDLFILDESNVKSVSNLNSTALGELTGSVTVNYYDQRWRKKGSVSVQDTAIIAIQSNVVNQKMDFQGITNFGLAQRVAARELRTLSSPLVTLQLVANREASQLEKGDPFKLSWPDLGLQTIIMRITEIDLGDGLKNEVKISAIQDVFTMPDVRFVADPEPIFVPPTTIIPIDADIRLVQELPYLQLIQEAGTQIAADAILDDEPDTGYVAVSAARPAEDAINADLIVDAGAGYGDPSTLDFAPYAILSDPISYLDDTIFASEHSGLGLVADPLFEILSLPALGTIDEEIVEVTAVDLNESEPGIIIKRAVLDTVPRKHAAGSVLLIWDGLLAGDRVQYVAGVQLDVKILPIFPSGRLNPDLAPIDEITMASRPIRPYPPGNVTIEPYGTDSAQLHEF